MATTKATKSTKKPTTKSAAPAARDQPPTRAAARTAWVKVELWIDGDTHDGKPRYRRVRLAGAPHAGDLLAMNIREGDEQRGLHIRVDRVVLVDRPTKVHGSGDSGDGTDDVAVWGTRIDREEEKRLGIF